MKNVGPDQTAKSATLKKEGVEMLSKPLPAPAKAGVNTVIKK